MATNSSSGGLETLRVAFRPEELTEYKKDFVGTVVDAKLETGVRFERLQLHVVIQTDAYEKLQHEWYPPSDKRGTKWAYFVEALARCGALKDIKITGQTVEERLRSFAEQLVGMKFRWVERTDLPVISGKQVELLLPVEYYGRVKVEKAPGPVGAREVVLE